MEINISSLTSPAPAEGPVEVVERKGTGHPDTICDALAEALSRALCRFYLDRFGLILHHNVDKALLWGGAARPGFGGGEVLEPLEIFLSGRATREFRGVRVPVEELAEETCRAWLGANFRALDPDRHVRIHSLIRAGSTDLVGLYLRQQQAGVALANDTSCGVGYAPLDELEQVVYHVERSLNASEVKAAHPEIGEDIKVMGVRRGEELRLTVACAFIDRHLRDVDDYLAKKARVATLATEAARAYTRGDVVVEVNTADDEQKQSFYLTVTGTSAEAGDDGEVGRGNRANGLITPYRPMNMEAAAGKNPVTHVGKLYNIAAARIARSLVAEVDGVDEASCYLVSSIGRPIREPQVVDVHVRMARGSSLDVLRKQIDQRVREHLAGLDRLWETLLVEETLLY